jgi:hypothetical protein
MNAFAALLYWIFDGHWPSADLRDDGYRLERVFAAGDVADIKLATALEDSQADPEALYFLKIARAPEGDSHLDIEQKTLTKLLAAAENTSYRKYLPALVDSFVTADRPGRRVNVFQHEPGFYTLEQVHAQHPALDARHLAWIFKRLLTVLGFCHHQNVLHLAVLPCHAMVHSAGHGLQLVGWGQSVRLPKSSETSEVWYGESDSFEAGARIRTVPARYRDWYPAEVHAQRPLGPATDLFLAARCLVYLAGGDPVTNRMPEAVPLPMRRFISTCLLESARMRPHDAWALLEEFDELLQKLYGPARFHELILT